MTPDTNGLARLEREHETRRLRILVVDDDELVLTAVARWLEAQPHVEVRAFPSAEAALNASSGRSFDVCLLDYSLGGVDGVMLGAMIRALNPAARLILMTGFPSPSLERQAMEHGFAHVLFKPVPAERLSELVLTGGDA